MAAPTDAQVKSQHGGSETDQLAGIVAQLNNLIDRFRAVCTKLDADAGVTDVNYFSLNCDAAVATAPRKISEI